jgi:hypothetical protein
VETTRTNDPLRAKQGHWCWSAHVVPYDLHVCCRQLPWSDGCSHPLMARMWHESLRLRTSRLEDSTPGLTPRFLLRLQDHRHAVVDRRHSLVGGFGDDREASQCLTFSILSDIRKARRTPGFGHRRDGSSRAERERRYQARRAATGRAFEGDEARRHP